MHQIRLIPLPFTTFAKPIGPANEGTPSAELFRWSTAISNVLMKGIMTTNFAAAAGLTYFLPERPTSFLKTTKPTADIMATKAKH